MYTEYWYVFESETKIPDYLNLYAESRADGKTIVRLNPVSTYGNWAESTYSFWQEIIGKQASWAGKYIAYCGYGIKESDFAKKNITKVELFTIDTLGLFGYETELPNLAGCPVCGKNKKLNKHIRIDERSLIAWRFGFTDYGRLVVHNSIYQSLRQLNATGFQAAPVASNFQQENVMALWTGSIEKAKSVLSKFPGKIPPGIKITEYGEKILIIVPRASFGDAWYRQLDTFLKKQDNEEEIAYTLVPAVNHLDNEQDAKWFELEITGYAGEELKVNEYIGRAICPFCNDNGFISNDKLRIDTRNYDGTDICRTETGRICISKRLVNFVGAELKIGIEPVLKGCM